MFLTVDRTGGITTTIAADGGEAPFDISNLAAGGGGQASALMKGSNNHGMVRSMAKAHKQHHKKHLKQQHHATNANF